jgi:hypothetical protein
MIHYGYIVKLLLDALGELNCHDVRDGNGESAPLFRTGFSVLLGPFSAVASVSFGYSRATKLLGNDAEMDKGT